MIVPNNTIAFIPLSQKGHKPFDGNISSFLKPLNENHERFWFTQHFYKCLPLSIGNMQGFVFYSPFDLEVFWNGGDKPEDLQIRITDTNLEFSRMTHVWASSEFGHGILTFHFPVLLKTPPKINLITIAPPNYPTPGFTPMTGVVEADNLRFSFTLNFRIDSPYTLVKIKRNYPIMGILPIPRYFCDSFSLVDGHTLFTEEEIKEEIRIYNKHALSRIEQNKQHGVSDRLYYRGMDIEGNKFSDHQLPKKKDV